MFQLNKSQDVNTVAFYPNEVIASGSGVLFVYSQSYSNTVTGSIQASVISNPSNTSWVIAQFSGSLLPSASGQYTFESYELVLSGSAVWNLDITQWQAAATQWQDAQGTLLSDLISTDRAIISGSDVEPITEYVSPDDNGRYIVYLG